MDGKRLRTLRERKGYTQEELADAMGTSQRTVSAWENGQTPNGEMVAKLARELRTSTDYLLGLTDNPTPAHIANDVLLPRERAIINAVRRGDVVGAIRSIVNE